MTQSGQVLRDLSDPADRPACTTCGGPILQVSNHGDGFTAHPCGHRVPGEVVFRD